MIVDAIREVVDRKDLDASTARSVMMEMMSGSTTSSQIASFITAMRMKGETEEELKGFVTAMRENAVRIASPPGAVDLCGTGGDCSGTLNISTIASVAVAAAGAPVAKHGNRSVSSRSGSADLLEALGIPFDLDPQSVERCLKSAGICFMFAPVFHSSMRNVLGPRKEIGIRTFFNILGPMANPAGVENQLVGVYQQDLVPLVARVLKDLGSKSAMVVHGSGMDEITVTGPTHVAELRAGRISEYDISPVDFGIDLAEQEALSGGSPLENARAALSILKGESSPRADAVALNAAAALRVSGRASDIQEGIELVRSTLTNGRAFAKLKNFSDVSRALEVQRQMEQPLLSMRGRRMMPEVIVRRSGEMTSSLRREILSKEEGEDALALIDDQLMRSPSVLSVIVLNRLLRMLSGALPSCEKNAGRAQTSMVEALSSDGISVIAEYKPTSPSAPALRVPPTPEAAAEAFALSGVDAVSVLVEPDFFGGSPKLFTKFRSAMSTPMLFKDFVVSDAQIECAHSLGADSVLLIAKALSIDALDHFVSGCQSLGMEPLVELHDPDDISKVQSCDQFASIRLFGINVRDLRTMLIKSDRRKLRETLPADATVVAESGMRSPQEMAKLKGFDAVLVGSALMGADDFRSAAEGFVLAGRGVARSK